VVDVVVVGATVVGAIVVVVAPCHSPSTNTS
jgi:hypothetical protein